MIYVYKTQDIASCKTLIYTQNGCLSGPMPGDLCGCMHYHCLFFRFGPYFVEPVIAGLDPKSSQPFIASLDLIGCPMVTEDFVVSGTCSEQMYGMCETLYRPNMVCF